MTALTLNPAAITRRLRAATGARDLTSRTYTDGVVAVTVPFSLGRGPIPTARLQADVRNAALQAGYDAVVGMGGDVFVTLPEPTDAPAYVCELCGQNGETCMHSLTGPNPAADETAARIAAARADEPVVTPCDRCGQPFESDPDMIDVTVCGACDVDDLCADCGEPRDLDDDGQLLPCTYCADAEQDTTGATLRDGDDLGPEPTIVEQYAALPPEDRKHPRVDGQAAYDADVAAFTAERSAICPVCHTRQPLDGDGLLAWHRADESLRFAARCDGSGKSAATVEARAQEYVDRYVAECLRNGPSLLDLQLTPQDDVVREVLECAANDGLIAGAAPEDDRLYDALVAAARSIDWPTIDEPVTDRPPLGTRVRFVAGPRIWRGEVGAVRAWTPGQLSIAVELDGGQVVFAAPAQLARVR